MVEESLNVRDKGNAGINVYVCDLVERLSQKVNSINAIYFVIIYVLFSTLTVLLSWWGLLQFSVQIVDKSFYLYVLPLGIVAFSACLALLLRWRLQSERIFVLIAFPVLVLFALFILPNQIPDEIWHIYRVFDLRLFGDEMIVPTSIVDEDLMFSMSYADLYSCVTASSDWSDVTDVHRDMSAYLVHLYILPSLIVHICGLLNINVFVSIFLARISNAILFLVAGYWIIKHTPIGKTLFCVYLWNPMLIQQEASCSVDVVVNIVSLMFISHVLYLKYQKNISKKDIVLLLSLFIVMSISKYVYILLGLLLLVFVPRINKKISRIGIYLATCCFILFCAIFILLFYNEGSYYESIVLIRNPPELFQVLFNTLREVWPLWVKETFGMILGALNVTVWEPCFWVYCLALFSSLVFNLGEKRQLAKAEKIFFCALSIISSILMILIFREWTLSYDRRADIIMGAQGRYFIPFVILPLIAAISPKSSLYRKNILVFFSLVMIIIYFIDLLYIIKVFM